jgi:hypothetical protein
MNSEIINTFQNDKKRILDLCDKIGFNFKQIEDPKPKIAPLIKNLTVEDLQILDASVISAQENLNYLFELQILNLEKTYISPKQKALLDLFGYLAFGEGIFSELVQILTWLLVLNGHDLYDPRKMKFANSYEQTKTIDLYVKLQFLEKHGYKELADSFDRDLRNCIAHLDFTLDENGNVYRRENAKKSTNIKRLSIDVDKTMAISYFTFLKTWFAILEILLESENNNPV